MSEVTVRERYLKNGKKVYEYCFELAHEGGKRRRRTKSGFATKREARAAGRQAFITDLYNDGFSVNTVTSIKGLLTKSFNFAVDRNYIPASPAVNLVIPKNKQPDKPTRFKQHIFLEKDQVDKIFERFPKGTSSFIPLKIAYHTGMRPGEVFGLIWDDIDFVNKTITVAPMKAVKKMLVLMEIHLDASIDKLDNLAMDVQLDKEKHMENAKAQKQTEPERAEAERVEAEVVYAPMVAEPQEYQYNADAFEARGVDEVKQEAAHKEAPKVRDDKAR